MQELNMVEVEEVSGGFAPIIVCLVAMAIAAAVGGSADGDSSGSRVTVEGSF